MKKLLPYVALFVGILIGLFGLVGFPMPSNFVQSFVELPDDLKVRIGALVLAVVSFFFIKLIELVPFLKFIEPFRVPLAIALSGELVVLIQNAVPDAFGAIAVLTVRLVLEILAIFIVFAKLKRDRVGIFK